MNIAVIKTGGKQYVVKENDELYVDRLLQKKDETLELPCLLISDTEGENVHVGKPYLEKGIKVKILEHTKGEKIRILRFKAKVRYRRRKGFRPFLTKIKVLSFSDKKVVVKKEPLKKTAKKVKLKTKN